ncbi:MAG TPA: hypothetical protein VGC58_00130, partial [Candidatus Paceibacterota bacterium]
QRGQTVNHAYSFSGDYSVVLNAYASDKQAVSRIKVKVVEPIVGMTKISGGVELVNKSAFEINLEGWILKSKEKTFVFPKDTLISQGGKIIFDDKITGIISNEVELLNPLNKSFASSKVLIGSDLGETSVKLNELYSLEQKARELQQMVAKIPAQVSTNSNVAINTTSKKEPVKEAVEVKSGEELDENMDQTASTILFEGENNRSAISKFFLWPIKGIDFIVSIFSKD